MLATKIKIGLIIASILSVFSPLVPLLLTVGCLTMTDFTFAIYKQYKLNPDEITSRRMLDTVIKFLIMSLALIAVFCFETYMLGSPMGIMTFTKGVASLIALSELKSIDESFEQLYGYSIFKKMIKTLDRGKNKSK